MFYTPLRVPTSSSQVRLSELVAAFSYALDLTEGQPAGHSIRCCWIGSQIGRALSLGPREQSDLYYTLLLKDLGCSSNAARICELYEADDLAFKRGYKTVGTSLAASMRFVLATTANKAPWHRRTVRIGRILRDGPELARELTVARCTRGADIARELRFSDAVSAGIFHLDEHWDGSGKPDAIRGDAIPLFSRIALLAQVADVFHRHAGADAALDEVRRRSGSWLDPELVRIFERLAADRSFWMILESPAIEVHLAAFAPHERTQPVDDDYLDAIAIAFGQVIDAKSPYTAGHSRRVAELAGEIAWRTGVAPKRRRPVWRAALLHDIGKLGVSNTILDKPAALDEAEWTRMRDHASHTREILGRIGAMAELADIAAAHHERLDGGGYPLGLADAQIARETRIITVCDFFDALTADRPYRAAMTTTDALGIIEAEVGTAIDGDCFQALRETVETAESPGRWNVA
jgi:putative nucleotidyltransferase with HDIG domain